MLNKARRAEIRKLVVLEQAASRMVDSLVGAGAFTSQTRFSLRVDAEMEQHHWRMRLMELGPLERLYAAWVRREG